jgi:CRP-like cAMP-binding protein
VRRKPFQGIKDMSKEQQLYNLEVTTYQPGEKIFEQGEQGHAAFLLKEGKVEITRMVDGSPQQVAVLEPITIFGEMALFMPDGKRTAGANALETTQLITLTKASFENMLRDTSQIIKAVFKVLVGRLNRTTTQALKAPKLDQGLPQVLKLMQLYANRMLTEGEFQVLVTKAFGVDKAEATELIDQFKSRGVIEYGETGVRIDSDRLRDVLK